MRMKSQYHCRTTRPGGFALRPMDQSLVTQVHPVKDPDRHVKGPRNF